MTSAENITLEVKSRTPGKGPSGRSRRDMLTPAIVYGAKTESTPLLLEEKVVVKYATHEFENAIFTLKSDDSKVNNTKVLIKTIDRDPVSRRPLHVDFFAPDMTQEVRVNVEVKYEGKAAGEFEGGQLEVIRRSIEIDALPSDIPDKLTLDVSELKLNEVYHLSDLKLPEGVKLAAQEDLALVTVNEIKEQDTEPDLEGAQIEAAAEGEGAEAAPAGDAKAEGGDAAAKPEGEKKDS